ncbi:MAG: hypothetical protein KIT80_01790 [Chitinophagaceae bacterium]|nr:hypothetical protein [Chitinophagaceae bacterium]MCW5925617.1 hypothetical protein [Chitinophagaceae bacterium]
MLTTEKKALKVGKYVSTKHVDTLIRTYKQERWAQNSARIGKEDSLTVWYSVEELQEFLEKAKSHAADGIKFCFGVYPDNFEEKPEYAGRQTLVMVATKSKEQENGLGQRDIYIQGETGTQILAYNWGKVCPPMCPPPPPSEDIDNPNIGITIVDKSEGMVIV